MAADYDTRPRDTHDKRVANDPYAAGRTPGSPIPPASPARPSTHPADPPAGRSGNRNVYYIVGGLVVAVIVLFLLFGGVFSRDQAVPASSPATTAPATQGTAPADTGTGTGTGTGTDTGTGTGTDTGTGTGTAPTGGGTDAAPADGTGTTAPATDSLAPAD